MALTRIVNGVPVEMTPQEEAAEIADRATRAAVVRTPDVIKNWQFRAQLRRMNPVHLANLKAFILTQSEEVQDWWQYELIIPRSHANVEAARVALGYSQAQVNATFRNAALIT